VTCHPPLHLRVDQIWINDRPAPLPPEPTGPLLWALSRAPGFPPVSAMLDAGLFRCSATPHSVHFALTIGDRH